MRRLSLICRPIVCTGFMDAAGYWKMNAISWPRMRSRSRAPQLEERFAVERDLTQCAAVAGQQLQQRERADALAAAAFAHDAEHFTRRDIERDAAHRVNHALLGIEQHVQVAHAKSP